MLRAFSFDENKYKKEPPFTDLKANGVKWMHPFVAYGYELKIIPDQKDNLFRPLSLMTRAEMAEIIFNAYNRAAFKNGN